MGESRTRGSNRDSSRADEVVETDGPVMSMIMDRDKGRVIELGKHERPSHLNENYIITAKYTKWTFIPKFLFEQFRRYANIFFLSIGLMQQIPDVSPTGRYVTIMPFTVILMLTALKELIEDYKRHSADKKVNSAITSVYDPSLKAFKDVQWKDICVGDILRVNDARFFPADLILLSSSEPQGICYIETSNLDGETNLKIRSALPLTVDFEESNFHEMKGELHCELPNRKLYEFNGNIKLQGTKSECLNLAKFGLI